MPSLTKPPVIAKHRPRGGSRDAAPVWRVLMVVFLAAVALNYPWELAQSPLFTAASHPGNLWLHCFVASLGDGVIVLVLFAVGWTASGRRDWFMRPGRADYAMLATAGAVLALSIEWSALHLLQRWTYTDAMPRIPGIDVGLVPVLQMVLLPPLIFRASAAWFSRTAAPPPDLAQPGGTPHVER